MKVLATIDSIGTELDLIYEQIETGDLDQEDSRILNMKLRVLAQRADLIRDHALEVRVETITKAFEEQRQQVRRIA